KRSMCCSATASRLIITRKPMQSLPLYECDVSLLRRLVFTPYASGVRYVVSSYRGLDMRAQRKRGAWRRLAVVGLAVVPALAAQTPARQVGAAANAMRALELEDYYRIKTATAPALSADGKR